MAVREVFTGTVAWFNTEKGFGFIRPHDGGEDIFVHYSNIVGQGFTTLREGQQVRYRLGEGPRGVTAVEVHAVVSQ